MSSYINTFLKTELTCIPSLLRKFIGDYYNSAASNGACWLFFAWCILHWFYSHLFRALFRRMGCQGYINKRLRQSLWYLGFYSAALIYCGASLIRSDFIDSSYRIIFSTEQKSNSSNDLMVGFIFLISFYMHSTLWETFIMEDFFLGFNYFLFVIVSTMALYMGSLAIVFGLNVVISVAHVAVELSRIVQMMSSYDSKASKGFFILSLLFVLTVYTVALPVSILLPVVMTVIKQPTGSVCAFIAFCMQWLSAEILTSPLYKLANHYVFHTDPSKEDPQCPSCFVECALFLPRDDVAYNINMYRDQVKAHREKMMSMRKPKNKNMLVQTLKCMVALRRKAKQKRLSESSDSDESERSESDSKDEPEIVEEEESDSEEESEKQLQGDNEDGVLIQEITDDAVKDDEEVVDGKLQIRVKEKKHEQGGDKHPQQ